MNYFEQLIGQIGGQPYYPNYLTQMQQRYVPCRHPNCPVCIEENKNLLEHLKKIEDEKNKKSEDYKNRCKEYMINFRKRL